MKRISINDLSIIYEKLVKKNSYFKPNQYLKFHYLNLSIHYSRDEREFDINNYILLKSINFKKENFSKKTFKNINKISGYNEYFNLFKEKKYLPNNNLPLIIFLDILKFGIQLIDIFGITFIVILSKLINIFSNSNYSNFALINKKIFSIYYWRGKRTESSIYYYPSINSNIKNKAFISSFADSKYFSSGLMDSLFNSTFLSPANILNFKGLFLSLIQFLHLYMHDIYLATFKNGYSFFKFWVGWKRGAEIFYSILIYNSLISLAKNSKKCEFISWHENQITNRSFSLAISYVKRNYLSSCALSSYNGTLFTQETKKQFLPLNLEFKIGFWGETYYVQDLGSLAEMRSYLKKEKIKIKTKVVPTSMQRIKSLAPEKDSKPVLSRNLTIITHASYWDLIACLLSIFCKKNRNYSFQKELDSKEKKLFIRLHPSLNKKDALREIKKIQEIPNSIKYEFIEYNKESLLHTLKTSKYCFFVVSTYVNYAIEVGTNVISVQTNHILRSPIKLELKNASNLLIIDPW